MRQSSDWSHSRSQRVEECCSRDRLDAAQGRRAVPPGGDIVYVDKGVGCRCGDLVEQGQVGEDFAMEGMPRAASACGLLP